MHLVLIACMWQYVPVSLSRGIRELESASSTVGVSGWQVVACARRVTVAVNLRRRPLLPYRHLRRRHAVGAGRPCLPRARHAACQAVRGLWGVPAGRAHLQLPGARSYVGLLLHGSCARCLIVIVDTLRFMFAQQPAAANAPPVTGLLTEPLLRRIACWRRCRCGCTSLCTPATPRCSWAPWRPRATCSARPRSARCSTSASSWRSASCCPRWRSCMRSAPPQGCRRSSWSSPHAGLAPCISCYTSAEPPGSCAHARTSRACAAVSWPRTKCATSPPTGHATLCSSWPLKGLCSLSRSGGPK